MFILINTPEGEMLLNLDVTAAFRPVRVNDGKFAKNLTKMFTITGAQIEVPIAWETLKEDLQSDDDDGTKGAPRC